LENVATKFAEVLHGPIAQVERRSASATLIRGFINPNELFSVWKWQRPQQRAFDHGKNGRVCADAERQR
jgi:hypothetical protein